VSVEDGVLGEALEEDDGEVVDVAGLEGGGFGLLGGFADAVAAELDGVSGGEDVGGLDVLVDDVGGVEGLECVDEADGDLASFVDGEGALAEDLAEVGVGWLEDGVDEGGAFEVGLTEAFEGDEVGLVEVVDGLPALEDLVLVVDGLDEAEDGGLAGAVGSGEEGAASFGADELFDGDGAVDGLSFVVVPKSHGCLLHSWDGCRERMPGGQRVTVDAGGDEDPTPGKWALWFGASLTQFYYRSSRCEFTRVGRFWKGFGCLRNIFLRGGFRDAEEEVGSATGCGLAC
jgi:hypothetical protein